MHSLYLKLGKDILTYGIGGLFARGFTLIALPIYTRIFSPSEFGSIETLVIINNFLGIFLTFGMDSTQSYYFSKQKKESKLEQQRTVSGILYWRLCSAFLIISFITLCSPIINTQFFANKLNIFWLFLSFTDAFLLQITYQCADIFRLNYQAHKYLIVLFLHQFFSFVAVFIFVNYLEMGVIGYITGMLLGSSIIMLFCIFSIRDYLCFPQKVLDLWLKLLKFGAPLIPAGIALYVIQSIDRWFILHYHGDEVLGLYSAGAKVALMFTLGIEVFRKAWWPIVLEEIHNPQNNTFIRNVAHTYFGFTILAVIIFTVLSPLLMKILVAPQFETTYYIAAILAWQGVFWGFYMFSCLGLWRRENTKSLAMLTILVALVNIILDYLLVPKFGMLGAAISTVMIYFIWNIFTMLSSEASYKIGFDLKLLANQFIYGGIACSSILLYYRHSYYPIIFILTAIISTVLLAYLTVKNFKIKMIKKGLIGVKP